MSTSPSSAQIQTGAGTLRQSENPLRGPKLSLWDIEAGLADLMEAREEAQDEAARNMVDQAITEYVQREVQKVDMIRAYLRHCEVMAKAAKEEAERQSRMQRAWEDRGQRLRAFCVSALQAFGRPRVEGRTGKLIVKGNGGLRPLLISDESQIPDEYKPAVVTYPVDKDKLRAALEAGLSVPGASLGERGVHLEVR